MRNVLVVGICGVGKTTLARELADRLGIRHIEVDALRHGPQWSVRPELAGEVERLTAEPGWVADSDAYQEITGLLWSRADTVVWLDLAQPVVLARIAGRTFRRLLTRQQLWAGNTETLRGLLSRRHPLVKVALDFRTRRARTRARLAAFPGEIRHLRRPAQATRWLATVSSRPDSDARVCEGAS
jgi:adenylate kinase family enzyme